MKNKYPYFGIAWVGKSSVVVFFINKEYGYCVHDGYSVYNSNYFVKSRNDTMDTWCELVFSKLYEK